MNDLAPPLTLINARWPSGAVGSLRLVGSRIAAFDARPAAGERSIDLAGDRLLPGLINAHDHLQLNSLPSLATASPYAHVREWIEGINTRRRDDPAFEAQVAVARDTRLLVGGLKNLLSGVTTVAHHDPLYPFLASPRFPVRVVSEYGWSHSLYIDGVDTVRESFRATPAHWPWIIHAAEGVDAEAQGEFDCLESLGCMAENTVLVHGVALDYAQRRRLQAAKAGLVWCPSSNLRLFDKTAAIEDLLQGGRIALGTDSRLSGARDLLDELRHASRMFGLDAAALQALATVNAARLLRLTDRGELRVGYRADLLILPPTRTLSTATRADVRMVLIDGEVRYADQDYAAALSPGRWAQVYVDDRCKLLKRDIADLLPAMGATEHGLKVAA